MGYVLGREDFSRAYRGSVNIHGCIGKHTAEVLFEETGLRGIVAKDHSLEGIICSISGFC